MAKLVCPNCGAATSFSPALITGKGILLNETTEKYTKWGKVRISAVIPYQYSDNSYAILVCQACDEYFVAEIEKYAQEDDWLVVYPIQRKTISAEIPEPIKSEFEEANLCFAIGAYRACAAMCQRTLESLCHDKKVPGLNQLKSDGIISPTLFDQATEIRLWAGIVKHKPLTESVSKEDAEQLLTYLEIILNDVYVEPKRLERLKKKREQIENK